MKKNLLLTAISMFKLTSKSEPNVDWKSTKSDLNKQIFVQKNKGVLLKYPLFTCLLFLLINNSIFGQAAKPRISKEPNWITQNSIDYTLTKLDRDAADGFVDISFEKQISLPERSRYFRRSRRIISQAGVQDASMVSVNFDPSYEQLFFHSIRIIRNATGINKLELSKIKTVHQESDLYNYIYDGSLNAVLILEDVRVGDVIEYSYSITGFNPVFNNKFSTVLPTNFSVPIYRLYYKLITTADRPVYLKNANDSLNPSISQMNGQKIYEWNKVDIAPLTINTATPTWHDPYGRIMISEFRTWKEVNDWALQLFPLQQNLSAAIQEKIAAINKTYTDKAGKIGAALKFVQDEIRYMGIEIGENSHKPASPSKVFGQRFGDCKEKSYLLSCMLNAMQIEASPVLINTEIKKELANMLPAPTNFNHTTVRVKLDTGYLFFDPTISYQRGPVSEIYYPDYQMGLVINPTTEALASIPFRNHSNQHIDEYFKVKSLSGDGTLTVITNFKGEEADNVREHYQTVSITEAMNTNQKFYAKYYSDIKADSLNYVDNDSSGIFTTREYYSIPNFWVLGKTGRKFEFTAFTIDNILFRPKVTTASMPVGFRYPSSYKENITISLPEKWNIDAAEFQLKNNCFSYNSNFYLVNNQVHLDASYESYKDFIATTEFQDYTEKIKQFDEKEYYSLSYDNDNVHTSTNTSPSNNLVTSIILAIVIGGALLWYRRAR